MNISISLPPDLVDLIEAKLASGRYGSASEVVCEALRALERGAGREAEQIAYLRRAWEDGIESGDAGPLDFDALRADAERERAARGET